MVRAQDLEPRAYSNSPTGLNFLIAGYAYANGSVLTDPSLPLDNVTNDSHLGVFAFATTLNVLGKSAKFDVIPARPARSTRRDSPLAGHTNGLSPAWPIRRSDFRSTSSARPR